MWSALTADDRAPAMAADGVAELKAWARRVSRAGDRTRRERARALARRAAAPWRFLREAKRIVPSYAPCVADRFGISIPRQVLGVLAARVGHGLDPIAYYRFQLFRPDRWKAAARYVQTGDTRRVLDWLVTHTPGYVRVFGDKRSFERWCVETGLPTVRTLMTFEDGRLASSATDAVPPPRDLFSKPSNSQAGDATDKWTYRSDRTYVSQSGRVLGASELLAHFARTSSDLGRPILVQPALRNGARELPLTPGGLCTVRMTTIRRPRSEPHLMFAVFRIPVAADCAADNFGAGGISCPVDLSTGRLRPGIRKDLRLHSGPIEWHPTTGAQLAGHELSWWSEAVELSLRAHRAIASEGVPVIGWDIALLDEGPVLVEGNNVPCSTFAQMVLERPLGDLPIVDCINAHLRECFGAPGASR